MFVTALLRQSYKAPRPLSKSTSDQLSSDEPPPGTRKRKSSTGISLSARSGWEQKRARLLQSGNALASLDHVLRCSFRCLGVPDHEERDFMSLSDWHCLGATFGGQSQNRYLNKYTPIFSHGHSSRPLQFWFHLKQPEPHKCQRICFNQRCAPDASLAAWTAETLSVPLFPCK